MFFHRIWPHLEPEIEDLFTSAARALVHKRGEAFYRQGDPPKGLYFVEEGLVGLTLVGASSGKEHLLRFFKAPDFFGHRSMLASEPHHATALALEKTKVNFLPRQVVAIALEKYPKLYQEISKVLSLELRRAEVGHVMILENQVLARTAQAIIYLKEIHPSHPWTRQEIANFCASTTSTIIKAMGELESRGLIRQEGREIIILNREGLISIDETETF